MVTKTTNKALLLRLRAAIDKAEANRTFVYFTIPIWMRLERLAGVSGDDQKGWRRMKRELHHRYPVAVEDAKRLLDKIKEHREQMKLQLQMQQQSQ